MKWVADSFATKHTDIRLTYNDFYRWFDDSLKALDQPSFDGINSYYISRVASENGLRVALSGLGGDELFGGYPFFNQIPRLLKYEFLLRRTPQLLTNITQQHSMRISGIWKIFEYQYLDSISKDNAHKLINAYQVAQVLFPSWLRKRLAIEPIKPFESGPAGIPPEFYNLIHSEIAGNDLYNAISKLTLRLFMGERCLRDLDSMSMAVSIEARAPFTDHILVENCLSIPAKIRCAGPPNKPFEWELFKNLLGNDYPIRKKQGFIFPFQNWLSRPEGNHMISNTLQNKQLCNDAGLSHTVIKQILDSFQKNQQIPWSRLWALIVLIRWCEINKVVWVGK